MHPCSNGAHGMSHGCHTLDTPLSGGHGSAKKAGYLPENLRV